MDETRLKKALKESRSLNELKKQLKEQIRINTFLAGDLKYPGMRTEKRPNESFREYVIRIWGKDKIEKENPLDKRERKAYIKGLEGTHLTESDKTREQLRKKLESYLNTPTERLRKDIEPYFQNTFESKSNRKDVDTTAMDATKERLRKDIEIIRKRNLDREKKIESVD